MKSRSGDVEQTQDSVFPNGESAAFPEDIDPKSIGYVLEGKEDDAAPTEAGDTDEPRLPPGF